MLHAKYIFMSPYAETIAKLRFIAAVLDRGLFVSSQTLSSYLTKHDIAVEDLIIELRADTIDADLVMFSNEIYNEIIKGIAAAQVDVEDSNDRFVIEYTGQKKISVCVEVTASIVQGSDVHDG